MNSVSILKELSELLTDSQRNYAEVADRVERPDLKERLMRAGNARAPLIEELANELARRHEEVPMHGTLKGELQRTWNALRGALLKSDVHDLLLECERSEQYLLERYEAAIAHPGSAPELRAMLGSQLDHLRAALTELITLERSVSK